MIRYAKQRDATSCGPVALVNVLKWAGTDTTLSEVKGLRKVLGTQRKPEGTSTHQMDYLLRAYEDFKVYELITAKERPTLKWLDKHLDAERIAVIGYYWKRNKHTLEVSFNDKHLIGSPMGGHYCLVTEKQDNRYICINDSRVKSVVLRNSRHIDAYLNSTRDSIGQQEFAMTWILEKT